MRLGIDAGYSGAHMNLPMEVILEADRLGYYAVWTAEAYGSDAITPLAWMRHADQTDSSRHCHHADARTQTQANTAMTAITLNQLSGECCWD